MKLIITISLSLLVFFSFGQDKSLRKGKLVTLSNDTIDAMIYHKDILNYKKCTYEQDGQTLNYSPSEIKGYLFNDGAHYISKSIPVNDDEYEQRFVEYLVEGVKNLYVIRHKGAFKYYIDYDENKLLQLHYGKKEVKIEDVKYFQKDRRMNTALLMYFEDASDNVKKKIEYLENPSTSSLTNITEQYHNESCGENSCVVYRKDKGKLNVSIAPTMGYMVYPTIKTQYNNVGALLYLWLPNSSEHLYVRTGFIYGYEVEKDEATTEYGDLAIIPIQFEYRFGKGVINPRLNLGFNYYHVPSTRKNDLAFSGGAGLNVNVTKRFSLFGEIQTDILVMSLNIQPFSTYSPMFGCQIKFY
ncbi:hypothetical protein KMW28_14950 [Flammeovirga yaeyamensis]|uniref:Outer membrane protein beta-barrel domain-containing protein n=1 Tax=Flammeovirga yaeyamensis TaxID=367791 RepID=A0AAX1N497_9BACT|nr:hypothetical protein [Flammeovirga yaeyamensis]MBB3700107.1 hypothetical protein [Flammeovirga yaeyamensis]NMF37262.1 hypothetical protein [Flammeovirga yaeyamensis]QWG00950.1 hypothetical protein KMW28_14950 [Flammeovirga yaeyamensis]